MQSNSIASHFTAWPGLAGPLKLPSYNFKNCLCLLVGGPRIAIWNCIASLWTLIAYQPLLKLFPGCDNILEPVSSYYKTTAACKRKNLKTWAMHNMLLILKMSSQSLSRSLWLLTFLLNVSLPPEAWSAQLEGMPNADWVFRVGTEEKRAHSHCPP